MDKQRVRIALDCSIHQRAYIKMNAAKSHMTISEYLLSGVKVPNDETLAAMKELDEGKGFHCKSIEDFWEKMEIDPNA
jgi:hypothetical protein